MNGFFRLIWVRKEGKEVSTETDGWDRVLFLNALSPTQPHRRPKSASSEQSGICCVVIHFLHTRSLLINTILP